MTKIRVITSLIMAPSAICAILFLPIDWLAPLSGAIFLLGLWEWLRLVGLQETKLRATILVAMILMMWGMYTTLPSETVMRTARLVGNVFWLLTLFWLARPKLGSAFLRGCAGLLVTLSAWASLILLQTGNSSGPRWLLTALCIVWAADTGAYFVGRKFGRRPLAKYISPNKTIEGAFGGIIAGLLAALVFGWLAGAQQSHFLQLVCIAVFSTCAAIVGDLFESLLKRHAGMKDSGTLIPGHGGVLDRIDGVLAALPIFALGKDLFFS